MPNNFKNQLNSINKLFLKMSVENEELTDDILKENKIDPEQLVIEQMEYIKKIQNRARIQNGFISKTDLVNKAIIKLEIFKKSVSYNLNASLDQLFGKYESDGLITTHFRKLNNIDQKTALDMIDEINLLKILDELDKLEKSR